MIGRPIIKWVGGKHRLLPELQARMPAKYNRYFEPFLGGGALFFALAPKDAVLGDANTSLMDMYSVLARDVEGVIEHLKLLRTNNALDSEYYYTVREWWNDGEFDDAPASRAAAFIFLNKTCFNGIWRENREGAFNVPKGAYKDPKIFDPEALRAVSTVLRAGKISLRTTPYVFTTASATAGDFVYFDPPYDPVSETANFTSYTKGGFNRGQQRRLAEHARELTRKRGCQIMLSNSDTPFVRALYEDFHIDTVQCSRAINSNATKRGKVNELIITGGY